MSSLVVLTMPSKPKESIDVVAVTLLNYCLCADSLVVLPLVALNVEVCCSAYCLT